MALAAAEVGVPAIRIGSRHTLWLIRDFWRLSAVTTGPGLLPRHIEHLHHDPALLVLPTRQSRRSYQSGQDKLSGYPRKR